MAVVTALLLGLLVSAVGAPAAAAHDTIESSNPADGATVATVPASVTLTFDEQPQDFSPVIQVTGPDGADWADGTPTVSGTDVSVPVKAGAPAGAYQVAYRIVSSDGHPVTGELSFTAEAAAAGSAPVSSAPVSSAPVSSAPVSSTATSSTPAASTPSSSAAPSSSAPSSALVSPAANASDSGSGVPAWLIVVIVLVIAAGGAVVAVLVRRARGGSNAA
ncbi:copper resistance CopC family protein [Nakamurella flava]|uniref:copper resistance CopC family protein n=1 Tax=Nakamurella flava TaxID=2576308 RepID=UPI001409862F|nr:copper resistance CopC family protein [Nakamurella flava]